MTASGDRDGPAPFPPGLSEAVADRTVAAWLDAAGLRAVHLGLFDASGVLRQKRLDPPAAARAMESGWSFVDAVQWWGPDDTVRRTGGSTSHPARVELGSGRPYPFGQHCALFLAEFEAPLHDLSARFQLGRLVERAMASGLEALVGWEFECIVLEGGEPGAPPAAGSARPGGATRAAMATNRCWSALTLAAEDETLAHLVSTLNRGAVPVDHVCAELGPGCLEVATAPEAALASADSAALAKLYTKAHFAGRGQQATFMAQLGPAFPGLGGHPSLSLHSTVDGSSLLCDAPGVLSKTGLSAIAGVVALLPELLVLLAPSPNSYRRFGPGNWAPSTATWGEGNYSCALRVVLDDPQTARLELRIPGADVDPHACLAMFLGAALWGVEERLEPPPPVVAPDDGRDVRHVLPLPRDLVDACRCFEASAAARELFGASFVEHVAAAGRAEAAACHRFVSDEERNRYLAHV